MNRKEDRRIHQTECEYAPAPAQIMKKQGKLNGRIRKVCACILMTLSLVMSGSEWLDVGFVVAKAADTFTIGSYADLLEFRSRVNGGETALDAKLTDDIVCKANPEDEWYDTWQPIAPLERAPYTGTFDGNGYKITGLYRVGSYSGATGLFGCIDGGTVKDLTLEDVTMTNSATSGIVELGGIVGMVASGTISGCTISGTLASYGYVGGIAGQKTGNGVLTITDCVNNASISCVYGYAGGILGGGNALITDCTNNGDVQNTALCGGLIGGIVGVCRENGAISGCTNTGTIGSQDPEIASPYIGGITGQTKISGITDCTNSGDIYGKNCVGGIAGCVDPGPATVSGCENSGSVTTTHNSAGGIAGFSKGTSASNTVFIDCTNLGDITSGASFAGGIVGEASDTVISDCENSGTIAGANSLGGVTGQITIRYGTTNPSLVIRCSNTGDVGAENVGDSIGGVAGYTETNIKDSTNSGTVKGSCHVGGIAGNNFGRSRAITIEECENTGAVSSNSGRVGGIVGKNGHQCSAINCTNSGTITSSTSNLGTGGIAGWSVGDSNGVTGCTNSGAIHGNSTVGGIVGQDNNDISDCINIGTITGGTLLGGIAGSGIKNTKPTPILIINCTNSGNVGTADGSNQSTGGIVGQAECNVTDCTNSGTVQGLEHIGGIAGNSFGRGEIHYVIEDCENTGYIYASEGRVGGIVGKNGYYCSVSNCTNSGEVSSIGIKSNYGTAGIAGWSVDSSFGIDGCTNTGYIHAAKYVGGIAGWNVSDITDCINEGTVKVGVTDAGGIVGRGANGVCTSGEYPVIRNCSNSGEVTFLDPDSPTDSLGGIAGNFQGSICDSTNTGTVSGKRYIGGIAGWSYELTASGCSNEGDVSGTGNDVGGIVGWCHPSTVDGGLIEDSTNTGDITGYQSVGGIAGQAANTAMDNCSNSGEVTSGNGYAGGILGWGADGSIVTITDCDNTGDVTVTSYLCAAGIAGEYAQGSVTGCTNSGTITGIGKVAGIVGTSNDTDSSRVVSDCTNTGTINGREWVAGIFSGGAQSIYDCTNEGDINCTYKWAGGITGWHISPDAHLDNCTNNGSITFTGTAGGEAGYAFAGIAAAFEGEISDCTNNGDVTAINFVGGIEGVDYVYGKVHDCLNTGTITGTDQVGGILGAVGTKAGNAVVDNENRGAIIGTGDSQKIGGIAGKCERTIEDCTNSGSVTGVAQIGGISGWNESDISRCTNSGDISGYRYMGGIAGTLERQFHDGVRHIADCSNTGDIICITDGQTSGQWAGGIIGVAPEAIISRCTNTGDIYHSSGRRQFGYIGGIIGYMNNTAQNSSKTASNSIVEDCTVDCSVTGTYNVGGIAGCAYNSNIKDCSVSGTIDGSAYTGGIAGYSSISNTQGEGVEYGVNRCVNNASVTGDGQVGGIVGSGSFCQIDHCRNAGSVTVLRSSTGGIMGYSYSCTISSCYNTGNIISTDPGSSSQSVGGIVGEGYNDVKISSCYNTGDVSARNIAGGIAGYANTTMTDSYNIGRISIRTTENPMVGGVIGRPLDGSTIENSWYSTGNNFSTRDGLPEGSDTGAGIGSSKTVFDMTGINALDGMEFADGDAWLVKAGERVDGNTAVWYYPHLKGFDFDSEGAQKTADQISRAQWPAQTSVKAVWADLLATSEYDGFDKQDGDAKVLITTSSIPSCPAGSEMTIQKQLNGQWEDCEDDTLTPGFYRALITTGEDTAEHLFAVTGGDESIYTAGYEKQNAESWDSVEGVVDSGTYRTTVTFAESGRPSFSLGGFTVTPATAVVTPDDATKTFGDADPTFTATVTGLADGDSVDYTLTRAEGEDVGTYEITADGDAVQGNYNVSFNNPGTLAIGEREPEIRIDIPSTALVYDKAAKEPSVTVYDVSTGLLIPSSEYSVSYSNNINAGTATITISDVDGHNYNVHGSRTFTIGRANVTVTADNNSKTYGYGDPVFTATVTGLVGDDTYGLLDWEITRVSGESAGTYAINITGNSIQGNYNVTWVPGTFTITKRAVGISDSPSVNSGLVYDGTWQELIYGGTAEDGGTIRYALGQNGSTAPALDAEGTEEGSRVWKASVPSGQNAGTYYVWYLVEPDGNHSNTSSPACLTVSIARTGATVTADNKTMTYGNQQPLLTATVTGLIGEDTVSFSLSRAAGVSAGTYTINASGDAVQGNYSVTFVNGTFTINEREPEIRVEIDGSGFTYNKTAHRPAVDVYDTSTETEIPDGEYTVEYSSNINAGTATITISDVAGGNFNVHGTATFTIDRADATITADDKYKDYGQPDPAFTATVAGLQGSDTAGVLTWTLGRESGENAGGYAISPSGNAVQGNYNVTYVDGTLVINSIETAIVTEPTAKTNLVYTGGQQSLLNAGTTTDGGVVYYTIGTSGTTAPEFSTDSWSSTVPDATDSGTYHVWYLLMSNSVNYHTDGAEPHCVDVQIARAGATVSAGDYTMTYGGTEPVLSATTTGLKGSDGLTYTITREVGTTVGQYGVTVTGATVQGNYNVTFVNGTFTINEREPELRIEIPDAPIVFDGTAKEPSVTVYDAGTGFLIPAAEYSVGYTGNTDAGPAIITITNVTGNYNAHGSRTFTIAKAPVNVAADNVSKVYGGTDPSFTVTITGLQGSDTDSVITWNAERTAGEDAGTYTITLTGDTEQGNYSVTFTDGEFTITRAAAGFTAVPTAKTGLVYNGTSLALINTGTASAGGTIRYALGQSGSTAPAADAPGTEESARIWKTTAPEGMNADTYYVWYTVETDANHETTAVPVCIPVTIGRAGITVTADNLSATYGDSIPELTATVTGLIGNDTVSYDLARTEGTDAGTYTITASGNAVQGNYSVTFVNGTLTISARQPAVTIVIPGGTSYVYKKGAYEPAILVYETPANSLIPESEYSVTYSNNTNAGTATISVENVANGNYIIQATASFTITEAPVTVTAGDASKTFGHADPEFGVTITGLKDGDSENLITWSAGRNAGEDPGTYTITPSGDDVQGNYSITWVPGTFTIVRDVTGIATSPSVKTGLVYTGSAQTLVNTGTASAGGTVRYALGADSTAAPSADAAGTAEEERTWKTSAPSAIDAGTYYVWYMVEPANGFGTTGTPECLTVTIARADVTVTADDKTAVYGEAVPGLTATVTGLKGADSVDYTLARAEGENAGTHEITASGNAVQGNYNVAYAAGTLTIAAREPEITITVPGAPVTYDGTEKQPAVKVYEGTTEIPETEYSVTYSGNVEAGTATVTVSDIAGNYIVNGTAEFTIQRAAVTVRADNKSAVYGEPVPAFTTTVTGLYGTDTVSCDISGCSEITAAGSYIITVSGDVVQGSYDVTFVNGVLTVAKAPASFAIPVAKTGLVADGTFKTLVTGAAVSGGAIRFCVKDSADAQPEAGDFSASVPAAKDAGTYYVWYLYDGEGCYYDVEAACLAVTISEPAPEPDPIPDPEPEPDPEPLPGGSGTDDPVQDDPVQNEPVQNEPEPEPAQDPAEDPVQDGGDDNGQDSGADITDTPTPEPAEKDPVVSGEPSGDGSDEVPAGENVEAPVEEEQPEEPPVQIPGQNIPIEEVQEAEASRSYSEEEWYGTRVIYYEKDGSDVTDTYTRLRSGYTMSKIEEVQPNGNRTLNFVETTETGKHTVKTAEKRPDGTRDFKETITDRNGDLIKEIVEKVTINKKGTLKEVRTEERGNGYNSRYEKKSYQSGTVKADSYIAETNGTTTHSMSKQKGHDRTDTSALIEYSKGLPTISIHTETPAGSLTKIYSIKKNGTLRLENVLADNVSTLDIPATETFNGVTYRVTSIASWAVMNLPSLKVVNIHPNKVYIGTGVFEGSWNIHAVNIYSKKVKAIREDAFSDVAENAVISFKAYGKSYRKSERKFKVSDFEELLEIKHDEEE